MCIDQDTQSRTPRTTASSSCDEYRHEPRCRFDGLCDEGQNDVPTLSLSMAWCDRQQLLLSAGHWDHDPETAQFPVWETPLPMELCNQHLPQRLSYHKGYVKADAIWAQTARASQLRSDIRREFAALWRGGVRSRGVQSGNDAPLASGGCFHIKDSLAFLSAIKYGFRNNKAQVYAFTISVDGRLRFCEAAVQVMHVTMADALPEILFAGEFFLCFEAGRYSLCVTNNSGTYRADAGAMEGARALLAAVLPDIEVRAMDREDSIIKDLTTRHKGDPVHWGHSIHHQQPVEQRSTPQMMSAMALLGQPASPQPLMSIAVCVQQRQRPVATHRRVQTWGGPTGFVGCSQVCAGPAPVCTLSLNSHQRSTSVLGLQI